MTAGATSLKDFLTVTWTKFGKESSACKALHDAMKGLRMACFPVVEGELTCQQIYISPVYIVTF